MKRMKRNLIIGSAVAVVAGAIALAVVLRRDLPVEAPAIPEESAGVAALPETAQPIRPSFDIVRVTPGGGTVIAGRAEPGAEVTVLNDGQPIGRVVSDGRGEWVLVPDRATGPGSHELSLSARLPGEAEQTSKEVVMVVVPEPKEDIAGRAAAETGAALALAVPREGEGASTVLQAPSVPAEQGTEPAEASVGPGRLAIEAVEYDEAGNFVLGGRGAPNTRLQAYLDNEPIGVGTGEASGRWQVGSERPVGAGEHRLRVDAIDTSGRVVARAETQFARLAPSGISPGQRLVVIQPGATLWHISWMSYGHGLRYAAIYGANRDQIADPDLIYPGQVFVVPGAAAASGDE